MFCDPDSKLLLEKNPARVGNSVRVDISLHPLFKGRLKNKKRSDPVAQSVEHLTFNQGVMGSSPIGITTCKANFLNFRLLAFFVFSLGIVWLFPSLLIFPPRRCLFGLAHLRADFGENTVIILPAVFNTADTKSNTESHRVLIIRNVIAAFSVSFSFSLC